MSTNQPVTALAKIKHELENPQFAEALRRVAPRAFQVDRVAKVALVAITKTPDLHACTPVSIMQALMTAAELGLDPGGALSEAYLVPYKTTCQLIIGYQGLIKLARQATPGLSVNCRVVYRGEGFEIDYAASPPFRHSIDPANPVNKDDSNIIGAYLWARWSDGDHFEWMDRTQIDANRARSRASGKGPWVTDYAEMCRKTVCRRGLKYMPKSGVRLERALEHDNEIESREPSVNGQQRGVSGTLDLLGGQAQYVCEQCGAVVSEPFAPAKSVGTFCSKDCAELATRPKD